MADSLVTLVQAKAQLRVTSTHEDADITVKAGDATAIIIDYLKRSDHGWTVDTVPGHVREAILLQLTWIWTHRGDEQMPDLSAHDGLAPGVKGVLMRQRDPALA